MALRVLEKCRVSPSPASGPLPPLPLTVFDLPWLDLNSVERIFFYRFPHSTADFLSSHLPNLKSSLSLTLTNFYPLAGTIRLSSSHSDRFEIFCSDDDSVSLTISECDKADFDDISGHHARSFEKLLGLVPSLPKSPDSQPLLALQFTLFPKQGLCLGMNIHHAACDGFSSNHFLKSWAAAHRATPPPPPPLPSLDRSSIVDPPSLYAKSVQNFFLKRHLSLHNNTPPPSNLISATFTLSRHQIQSLRKRIQSHVSDNLLPSFHISTFVIACACAWISLIKANGHNADLHREAHLFFSVDWRNRMRPPPPANYFGNCLGCPCFVKVSVADIISEKDAFRLGCEAIGKAIQGIGYDVYEEMQGAFEKVMNVMPHKPLTIAGSPKLRVYETDFGWGKPVKVDVASIVGTGAISMAESRDDEGGVELGLILPSHELVEFNKFFNELQYN